MDSKAVTEVTNSSERRSEEQERNRRPTGRHAEELRRPTEATAVRVWVRTRTEPEANREACRGATEANRGNNNSVTGTDNNRDMDMASKAVTEATNSKDNMVMDNNPVMANNSKDMVKEPHSKEARPDRVVSGKITKSFQL